MEIIKDNFPFIFQHITPRCDPIGRPSLTTWGLSYNTLIRSSSAYHPLVASPNNAINKVAVRTQGIEGPWWPIMISLGPIFAIMLSRSHDCKNRPEGDHKVVIKGPPVCPDNNFVNVWKRLWYIDTFIHWYIGCMDYGALPVISSLASKNLHPASDGRCKECSFGWYCQKRLDIAHSFSVGEAFLCSVQHNQESMDTPRFTPEIYKDKEDMLVYEGECCGRLLYE